MKAIYQIGFDCHIVAVFTDRDERDRVLAILKTASPHRYWWQDVAMADTQVRQINIATGQVNTSARQ